MTIMPMNCIQDTIRNRASASALWCPLYGEPCSPRKITVGNAAKQACLLLAMLLALAAGCQLTYPRPYSTIPGARWNTAPDTPRELQKVTLPDYIIEPPDILTIDAVTLVPHPPYRLHPLDVVKLTASGLPDRQRISGDLTVGIDGTLVLGFGYDKVE